MKRLTIIAIFLGAATFTKAQISENAIGIRLEGGDGFGPEISYQRAVGDNNRFELDLGFADRGSVNAFKFTALYQWVWNIDGGFNWYAGFGAGVGYVDYDDDFGRLDDDDLDEILLTAEGIIGIEYSFLDKGVPIQLALDFNPEVELINNYYDDFDPDFAFSVRYQF